MLDVGKEWLATRGTLSVVPKQVIQPGDWVYNKMSCMLNVIFTSHEQSLSFFMGVCLLLSLFGLSPLGPMFDLGVF